MSQSTSRKSSEYVPQLAHESEAPSDIEETSSQRLRDSPSVNEDTSNAQHSHHVQKSAATASSEQPKHRSVISRVWQILSWTPPSCRYDPNNPPKFSMGLNLLFSFSTTATVGNLYYNQPILYQIADTFDVTFERSSLIATLMQAGYAAGLLLICPLGDVVERRPFILLLIAFTAILWLGLCLTSSFEVFAALSFICGFTTVTPQLMLPLIAELAPPHRRATALSIVVSGLALGILVARLLSGVVANYTGWRNVYWFSFAAQWVVFVALWLFMPAYPSKNPGGLNYFDIMWTIVRLLLTKPVLVQACLITFSLSAVFTSYWTTLSFLLSSPPFDYSSVVIGLFGLIGIVVILLGPLYSRFVIDKLTPLISVISSLIVELIGVTIGVFHSSTIAGPVVQAIVIDFANQASNIALRTVIYNIDPSASNRVNTAYMIMSFSGQITGTSAGNRLYAQGGWTLSGALSIALISFAIVVSAIRGPKEKGWIGWHGGWTLRRSDLPLTKVPATSCPEKALETVESQPPGGCLTASDVNGAKPTA